jgi:hypothetical protein
MKFVLYYCSSPHVMSYSSIISLFSPNILTRHIITNIY